MAGVRSPGNASDVYFGLDHAAADLAATTDIHSYLVPVDGYVVAWGYQVTTTINGAATAPVVGIRVADYDDSTSTTTIDSATIAHATAAANTLTIRQLNYGNGTAVTAGKHIIMDVLTAATTAGGARLFVIFRPGS